MAQLDEGVANLERFCGLLAQTNGTLQEQSSGLEAHAGDVGELEDSAGDAFGSLADEVEAFLTQLKQAEGDAVDGMEGLTESARTLADPRLSAVEQEVGETQTSFEQRIDGDRGSLEGDFSDLTASGFQALASGVDAAQGGVEASGQAAEEAFGGLDGGLQGFEQEVESFRSETMAGLSEAASGLTGEVAQGLESAGSECVSAWMDELPSEVQSGCSAVEGSVTGAYASFSGEGVGAGDELIQKVSTLSGEAADFLMSEQGGHVEEASGTVIDQRVPDLLAELGDVQATVGSGAEAAAVLEPMVGELEISKSVVAEVDEVLSAIGG